MPTSTQLEQAFLGVGAGTFAKETATNLRDEEQRGRLMRDAQVKTGCVFTAEINATFGEDTQGGAFVSEWIEFADLKFTQKPALSGDDERVGQDGEPRLDAQASNFNPAVHFTVPCKPQVLKWKTDEQGMYVGAKLLIWALGAVPSGYRALVFAVFTGPAILKG